ncbi:hypothetical protein C8R43DRAFT_1142719 [Mycena crocata]|nr:hypothetical protein C8R43DRAFT_1142719 [Mycena crocata]
MGRRKTNDLGDFDHAESQGVQFTFTADRGIYLAPDGLSRREELFNVWIPGRNDDFDEEAAGFPVAVEEVPDAPDTILGKCKDYASSVDPMSLWRPMKAFFLDELLRHEGLGEDLDAPECAHRHASLRNGNAAGCRLFKCEDCGEFLQCENCCVKNHAHTPLHVIKEWTRDFWTPCTLANIGLIYQLGHGCFPCEFPGDTVYKMTIIEAPFIHELKMRYCRCHKSDTANNLEQLMRNKWYPATVTDPKTCATFRSLESYRLYNVVGNMNVNNYIKVLEQMTDVSALAGMWWLPDRYKQFQRMAQQWAFLMRLKRAGLGHDPGGLERSFLGDCAVSCWACPFDGRNLPPDWHKVEPKYRSAHVSLSPLSSKKTLASLMASEFQKGERYANMDYIIMSALRDFNLTDLTLSYDIACQWKQTLPARMLKLPAEIRLPLGNIKLQCVLPVWHAASHNEDCQNTNSLSFKPGVGKTDGEGVGRVWSVLNPASFSTKDTSTGKRADVMEAKIDYHNHQKNPGQGYALQRKLVVAVAERDRQVKTFALVSRTVKQRVKRQWEKEIDAWLADPSKPNPYMVRLEVRKEEDGVASGGKAPLHGRSVMVFLVAGIQSEDAQQQINAELRGRVLVAADRKNRVAEWCHALLVKIAKFRTLQKIYMPGAEQTIIDLEAASPKPERVKIFMPSEMPAEDKNDELCGCVSGLLDMETKLHVAQCNNSLASLRSRLHAKHHFIGFRDKNITGQVYAMKARTLIDGLGERVQVYARRYRKGRQALVALRGAEVYPDLRKLEDDDIRLDGDAGETDAAARKKLGMIQAGRGARTPRSAPEESTRIMSWIWTAPGVLDDKNLRIHKSVRVEWSRARARKIRWQEEVMMLREEMRRVLRYLGWQSGWWREREVWGTEDVSPELAAGLRAYALKQAAWHDRLRVHCHDKWNISALTAAQRLVAVETTEPDNFFNQHVST